MNPSDYIKALDHHAYFIHSVKDAAHKLKEFLQKEFHIEHHQNPDFYHEKFESLGIDESRKIKENHLSRSFVEGNKRIFIIEANGITHEAQNSLLKIFEEPNENSHFFLIMPSAEVLLSTLRSRLQIIGNREENTSLLEAQAFLRLSKKDKVTFVDELAKKISDEEATKADAQEFLAALEIVLYKDGPEKNINALKAIIKARDYMNDRSPSIKQLLESVALHC